MQNTKENAKILCKGAERYVRQEEAKGQEGY